MKTCIPQVRSLLCPIALVLAGLGANPISAQVPTGVAQAPAQIYLRLPELMQPKLSPSGEKVAVRIRRDERHYILSIGEPGGSGPPQQVNVPGASVADFWWKSDDLLLLRTISEAGFSGPGGWQVFDLKTGALHPFQTGAAPTFVLSDLPDSPDEMLFTVYNTPLRLERGLVYGRDLVSLNVRTGKTKLLERDPGTTTDWFLTRQGSAFAAWGMDEKNFILWWRDQPGAKWKAIRQPLKEGPPKIRPLATAPDQRRLLVADYRRNPEGEFGFYDPATGVTEFVTGAGSAGANPQWERWGRRGEAGAVIGMVEGERRRTFLQPEAETLRTSLASALPGSDLAFESFSPDSSRVVARVESDRNAGQFLLVDRRQTKLVNIGLRFPDLKPEHLVPGRTFGFRTPAGLEVSGRILLPPGREHPPLLLFVRQAPFSAVDAQIAATEMQFFASRGYAVARLDSLTDGEEDGVGPAQAMLTAPVDVRAQLTAATRWLAAQGWVNGDKVAVLGSFAGGIPGLTAFAVPGVVGALVNFNSALLLTGPGARGGVISSQTSGRGRVGTNITPSTQARVFESASNARGSLTADLPDELPGVPTFHFYTVVNRPPGVSPAGVNSLVTTSSGIISRGGTTTTSVAISPQYESALALVKALRKKNLSAEIVTSAELARDLDVPWDEAGSSILVRARRDELAIEFLKKQGLE